VLKEVTTSKQDLDEAKLFQELKASVKTNISGFAVPDRMQICSGLPKTRSGKIMRRILRKVAANQHDDLGDVSTLADPSVINEIVKNHKKMQ
jgi:acetyl-CoA synthetase